MPENKSSKRNESFRYWRRVWKFYNDTKPDNSDSWMGKYIFPNSGLPSIEQIDKSFQDIFILEDLHNFGADYDKTSMYWFNNFNNDWPELKVKYSEEFYRMWKFCLLSCAGIFRARYTQLWQIVFSKMGISDGY